MDDAEGLEGDLLSKKQKITEQLDLSALINNPELIKGIKTDFDDFKKSYAIAYQMHHRDYYKEIEKLQKDLEIAEIKINAINCLNQFSGVGNLQVPKIHNKLKKICPEHKEPFIVSVDTTPICKECKLTLADKVPSKEVKKFIVQVDKTLKTAKSQLSKVLTPKLLEKDQSKENRLSRLSDLDLLEFSKKINMELIEYLETLFKEINIIPVQSNIFPELIKKYPFVEEDT
ncbi:MAG: hypothetical protein ACE5J3_05355, partial [Methanosarcinales archaeon]